MQVVPEYGERRDSLDQRWAAFLLDCGYVAIPLPNVPACVDPLLRGSEVAGSILTGGNDLVAYGGDAPERDETERLLLERSLELDKPVLGVCRGMQLIQDRYGVRLERVPAHVRTEHEVRENGSVRVRNSYHALGAFESTPQLEVLARAGDGVVESVRVAGRNAIGVMWHPERNAPYDELDRALVRELFG
ncbi:MAG: gamma-glutamyl-gamma-aminobutyrate hydrolase family protein [Candidatus Eremiobacteraeota bacterium]|nr:gamma-glutamyl-gamma-aminobutyrate hydrolase family protein [Candidatus Eremiobacteraeota bacterium]